MNILYLIGNGFDLAQGAKTCYPAFYKEYVNSAPVNDVEKGIIDEIREDIVTWSYMEYALGKFTAKVSDAEAFTEAYESLSEKLKSYLISEQAKIEPQEGKFRPFLTMPEASLSAREREMLTSSLQVLAGVARISAISFNYTDLFEKSIGYRYKVEDLSTNFLGRKTQLVSFVKIHGSLQNSVLLGVDRKEQIANEGFANNPDVGDFLIKPQTNHLIGSLRDREAAKLIEGANLIIVFGMSIGETDKSWWERIYKRLLETNVWMIIFGYSQDVNMSTPWKAGKKSREIKSRFMSVADVPAEMINKIDSKIFVSFDKGFFNPETELGEVKSLA